MPQKSHILVIDDEEPIRVMLRHMLESAGYQVSEAANGKIATMLYKKNPADLIITDLIMPEKEGIETIMEFKREFPHIKIIAISGGGQGGAAYYLNIAKKVGADSALSKPFSMESLLAEVKRLLGGD